MSARRWLPTPHGMFGAQCHVNCPTCHGNEAFEGPYEHRVIFDPSAPTLVVGDTPLVNRLRYLSKVEFGGYAAHQACQAMAEAADEIDRLNARIKELEKPPTRAITWKEEPPTPLVYNQPPHPGRCVDGPESHVWAMAIEESTISLHCDCQLCDVGMEEWFPEYFFTSDDIPVRIEFFNDSYGDDVNVYWHITHNITQIPTTQTEGANT